MGKKQHRRVPPRGSAKRVALPRFQPHHWSRWLAIADDRQTWKPSFDEWQQEVQERAERLRSAGLEVVWIDIEPESFVAWCRSRGYPTDVEARNRFAAEKIGNIPPQV